MPDPTATESWAPDPREGLAAGLHRHAACRPGATALVVDGRPHSYRELASLACGVAARLGAGGGPAGRVGVLGSRSLAAFAGVLGAAWSGAAFVPLGPKQPPARLAGILSRAGLSALVVDERGEGALAHHEVRAAAPALVLRRADLEARDFATRGPALRKATDTAYVMFTSGTTGVPKGVVVPNGAVRAFLDAVRARYAIGPADRVGQFCEATFDVSVFEVFAALEGGASLYVVPEQELMAPAAFVRREDLTVWTSVPSVIAMLSRLRMLEAGSFPTLRASFFIGEALPVQSARAWQQAAPGSVVDNQYGPTEATVACTVQRLEEPAAVTRGRGTMAIGREYAGMTAAVLGEGGRFLGPGEVGELALSGPQLADGYLGDPEQTARRFPFLDHPGLGRSRWYLTGDFAMRDADGLLHCLGRVDHQVKVLGHRVELEDVEANLRAASGSDAVAAVGWPVAAEGAQGIVAFVCGSTLAPAAIRERMRALVPAYMAPRRVLAVDSLPVGASGKVDRAALVSLLREEGTQQ